VITACRAALGLGLLLQACALAEAQPAAPPRLPRMFDAGHTPFDSGAVGPCDAAPADGRPIVDRLD
jgi:hypothetical protein